jgi:hypothetical protein
MGDSPRAIVARTVHNVRVSGSEEKRPLDTNPTWRESIFRAAEDFHVPLEWIEEVGRIHVTGLATRARFTPRDVAMLTVGCHMVWHGNAWEERVGRDWRRKAIDCAFGYDGPRPGHERMVNYMAAALCGQFVAAIAARRAVDASMVSGGDS